MMRVKEVKLRLDHLFATQVARLFALVLLDTAASAQERNLPEEVRALAVVCSSGASIDFRGQIEGGINRLFGKVLEGKGELEISKSEEDFLSSFEDEKLRLEARSVYNECVLGALQIVYNLKRVQALKSSDSRLLVPDSLALIQPSQRFALRVRDTVGMQEGGTISIIGTGAAAGGSEKCGTARIRISNSSQQETGYLDLSENFRVPGRRGCWISLYGMRAFGDDGTCVYSFVYQCL